ncbi:hypothetical protein GW17_00051564 [Ensete ventricosum]|nr:hypothetical protein GW17_00051564 [Ensete ventricosum]
MSPIRKITPSLEFCKSSNTPPNKVRSWTTSITAARSTSHPQGSTPSTIESDTLSSYSTDSLRAQLRQVNQRLDEVQKEFVKSKKELEGSSKGGSAWLKPSSILSFDQLAEEFELNFLESALHRPTAASLLGLSQGSDEPLAQFVGCFAMEIRVVPDAHPSLMNKLSLMEL